MRQTQENAIKACIADLQKIMTETNTKDPKAKDAKALIKVATKVLNKLTKIITDRDNARAEKDGTKPAAPKKGLSAYNLYIQDKKAEITERLKAEMGDDENGNPLFKSQDVMKEASKMWKADGEAEAWKAIPANKKRMAAEEAKTKIYNEYKAAQKASSSTTTSASESDDSEVSKKPAKSKKSDTESESEKKKGKKAAPKKTAKSDAESDEEEEKPKAKPAPKGKKAPAPAKKAAKAEESESDEEEEEKPAPKGKKAAAPAKKGAKDEESDAESDEEEKPAPKAKGKKVMQPESDDEEDDTETKETAAESDAESDEEEKPAPKAKGKQSRK